MIEKIQQINQKLPKKLFLKNQLIFTQSFRVERSTDQVIRAINLEALSKWVGEMPQDVVDDMVNLAPMLGILGYDGTMNPPNYEKSDLKVNYNDIQDYVFREKTSLENSLDLH